MMMEESSEAHMETDVSSTTEDIPEPKEATGSHSNMEMVIVVEELKDEVDFDDQNCIEASVSEENNTQVVEQSPKKAGESNKCDSKSPNKEIEPLKSIQKPTSKPGTPQKTVNNDLQPSKSTSPPQQKQQVEAIDSSSKIEVSGPKTGKQEKNIEENPVQVKEIQKFPEKSSPVKESQIPTPTKSPVKESSVPDPEMLNDNSIIETTEPTQEDTGNRTNNIVLPIDITIERDVSNECLSETITEEKEQNKSISRELKSLINSAKESKIISECTQITSKIRKSRTPLDTSLNTSETEKIQGIRRHSNNSQKSSCSEKSEKVTLKRSMRSQNPEFVSKVKQFLNSVASKVQKDSDEGTDDEITEIKSNEKREIEPSPSKSTYNVKKKKIVEEPDNTAESASKNNKLRSDLYCWKCHWDVEHVNEKSHAPLHCTVCPRTFHYKCLFSNERNKINDEKSWVCPECLNILNAESSETRSPGMKKITLGRLCELLKYALERMMDLNGVEPFMSPVDRTAFPDYDKYVVHPMDLSLMKKNIEAGLYGSTEAFLADANWILHNSIIFNTLQSKLTGGARALVRSCRAEMGEIEACPECYAAAHARKPTWFTDVCTTPHILLWAKLKGFPYWPAKGMSVNSSGLVDVRFFGAHDRAWVPTKDCFLYSEKDPNNFRTKRQDILDSMQEAEQHIRNISRKYGKFVYPPFKTQLEPTKLTEQLKMMIPSFEGEVRMVQKNKSTHASPISAKTKSRSNSKSSKSSIHEGDVSDSEDTNTSADKSKVTESKDETKAVNDQSSSEIDKTMEIDLTPQKTTIESRKRRRSDLDEGVITILDTDFTEKRKKVGSDQKYNNKTLETQEPSSSKEEIAKEKNDDKKEDQNMEVDSNVDNKAEKTDVTKKQDEEPSSSTIDKVKSPRMTPIKIIFANKDNKIAIKSPKQAKPKTSTPNEKPMKPVRIEKVVVTNKGGNNDKAKSQRRRSLKSNKSLNNSNANKSDKATDKKTEKAGDSLIANKEKSKDSTAAKNKDGNTNKSVNEKNSSSSKTPKDVTQCDDNTSLAMFAKATTRNAVSRGDITRLPTISHVMSLSTIAQNANTKTSNSTANSNKTIEITVEAHPNSSIFTPTSTDNVKSAKDAQSKLQKLRNETEPIVGRVGVRSFARMTSPGPQSKKDDIQSEIKREPIDLDDADRHLEKMDLMKSFELRPVNQQAQNLRDVRINKLVVTPLPNAKQNKTEARPRAKKSFPQPKKPDEGRSELNGKNSMVYIPIQPPNSQPPIRPARPAVNGPVSIASKPTTVANTTYVNSLINNQTTSLLPVPITSLSISSTTTTATSTTTQSITSIGQVATIGQVPTTVHTVPLMTSVNGQWMLSLQPVMSVGGVDNTSSSPIVNGIAERTNTTPALVPLNSNTTVAAGGAVVTSNLMPPPAANSIPNKNNENTTPGEPPRLQQRPPLINPLDANAPLATSIPPPSSVGPLTAKLNQNAVKLTDFFRNLIEDSLEKLDEPASVITSLRLQLEQVKWKHQLEINELKHNQALTAAEMRASFEKEMVRALNEARRVAQMELTMAVKQTKSKQWCANCSQEAQFYCCWNTSYCDYPCQRAHWSQHFSVCAQQRSQDNNNDKSIPLESRLQPQPDNLPKKAPALTVGGKAAPSRGFNPDQSPPQVHKPAIIVSMMEDSNGNQSMKCVGTYKPTTSAPVLINKQIQNKEESNKKVVTSGGYLIVGAGAPNSSTVITPSRRTHPTIQYI